MKYRRVKYLPRVANSRVSISSKQTFSSAEIFATVENCHQKKKRSWLCDHSLDRLQSDWWATALTNRGMVLKITRTRSHKEYCKLDCLKTATWLKTDRKECYNFTERMLYRIAYSTLASPYRGRLVWKMASCSWPLATSLGDTRTNLVKKFFSRSGQSRFPKNQPCSKVILGSNFP